MNVRGWSRGLGLLALLSLAACGATTPAAPATTPATAPAAAAPTGTPLPAAPTVAATAAPADGALTLTDGTGTKLTFTQRPEKIVCLYNRCTEVLASLGVTPLALPASMADLAADPGYFAQPNEIVLLRETNDEIGFDLEELAALKPDLVLGWEELRTSMSGIAPVYAVTNDMNSYRDSHAETRTFAALLGREAEAEAAIKAFLDRLEAYKRRSPKNRSVMYTFFYDDKVHYRDGESATCALFKEVASCDWPDPVNASSWSVESSIEGLLALNPDLLVVDTYGLDVTTDAELRDSLGADPLWQELAAYQQQRLVLQPKTLHSMDGMGTVGATRLLDHFMPLLYPEVFPQPLTEAAVQAALGGSAAAGPATVVDAAGTAHTFAAPPERVVCYYNSCYGMLATLGVMPVAQAVNPEMLTDPIYFEGKGADIPTLPRDGDTIDLEAVAAATPDLVLVFSPEEAQALDGIAPAFQEFDINGIEDVFAALRAYGKVFGREAQAEEAIARFEQRLAAYAKPVAKDITVLKLGLTSADAFSVSTKNDPICQILNQVARCDWDDPTGDTGMWSYDGTIESVLALDPDVILLNNWTQWGDTALDDEQLRAALAKNPLWQELRAVKSGRVLSTPGYDNPIASSLPAATKFLDTYMPLLYPENFPQPLTDADIGAILGQ